MIEVIDEPSAVGRRSGQSTPGCVNTLAGAKHSNHRGDKVILGDYLTVIFHTKKIFIGCGMGALLTRSLLIY